MDRCFLICGLMLASASVFLLFTKLTVITSNMGPARPILGIFYAVLSIALFVMARRGYLHRRPNKPTKS